MDFRERGSLIYKLRKKRHDFFIKKLGNLIDKKLKILDLGGESEYWNIFDDSGIFENNNIDIYLLNVDIKYIKNNNNKRGIVANGKDLSCFKDNSFDLVFSNSVIQYITNENDRKKMSEEIKRVSKRYFIQTANYYFPIDPDYNIVGFQFMPKKLKAYLLRAINFKKCRNLNTHRESVQAAENIKLYKLKELKKLFPNCKIYKEKFLFFNKSYIIYFGFDK